MNKYEERIIRDPQICGGDPVFKGTRVTLRTVLASLAAGDLPEAILSDFPALTARRRSGRHFVCRHLRG